MADCYPFWMPGTEVTCHCTVAVTGRRLVALSGNPVDGNPSIGVPGAGAACFGVAARDKAQGDKVLVYRGSSIVEIEAGAALAAGAELQCDAAGRVVALAGGKKVGDLVADVANGAPAQVALKLT